MEKNRGQAALEFLMTYAWALIMIAILIAAIAYFGVTRPKDLLPNRCLFNPAIGCLDYVLSLADDTFKIKLKNNFGSTIIVTYLGLMSEESSDFTCTSPSNPANWVQGNSIDLTFTACNLDSVGFTQGKTVKLFLNMSYYSLKGGPSYTNSIQGQILTKVS